MTWGHMTADTDSRDQTTRGRPLTGTSQELQMVTSWMGQFSDIGFNLMFIDNVYWCLLFCHQTFSKKKKSVCCFWLILKKPHLTNLSTKPMNILADAKRPVNIYTSMNVIYCVAVANCECSCFTVNNILS